MIGKETTKLQAVDRTTEHQKADATFFDGETCRGDPATVKREPGQDFFLVKGSLANSSIANEQQDIVCFDYPYGEFGFRTYKTVALGYHYSYTSISRSTWDEPMKDIEGVIGHIVSRLMLQLNHFVRLTCYI